MSRCSVIEDRPGAQATALGVGSKGLPNAVLFLTAEELLQGSVEERQLSSVIHQIFHSSRARQRLGEDPDRFIAGLKVRPLVKAILGLMKATLLAQNAVDPQFNWWWGNSAPDEEESTSHPTGSPAALSPGTGGLALLSAMG